MGGEARDRAENSGAATGSHCRVELLGGLRVICCSQVTTAFETRKTAALLGFLVLGSRRVHSREVLAEQLWPEEDPWATRPRLRQALSVVRKILQHPQRPGESLVKSDHSNVWLDEALLSTDAREFENLVRQGSSEPAGVRRCSLLAPAAELYRGELLPGFYEDWALLERARLQDLYVGTLLSLAENGEPIGSVEALDYARRAVAVDRLREEAHCALIRLYAAAGRPHDALRQYRELEQVLREELDAEPSAATRALMDGVRAPKRTTSEAAASTGSAIPVSYAPAPEKKSGGVPVAPIEAVGGAVPLGSPYYIERSADAEFSAAVNRQDSIVLIQGPRQVGKTSLLARGLEAARASGARVVLTDFQKLTAEQVGDAERLFRTLAEILVDQLDLEVSADSAWSPQRGWNVNFERFLRRTILREGEAPVVWALDEVDRLFGRPHASEVFGLFRSWHNERALDPRGPWQRLTLAIAYATEAHLFITDLNQSPFNVGTRLALEDFTPADTFELNRRYGRPLATDAELANLRSLVGGHPYLLRRGFSELARPGWTLHHLESVAGQSDGPFGDHLRRMRHALSQDPALEQAVRALIVEGIRPGPEAFFRLRGAGLLAGTREAPELRCRLYRDYLAAALA